MATRIDCEGGTRSEGCVWLACTASAVPSAERRGIGVKRWRGMARDPELATGMQDGCAAWGASGGSAGEEMNRASNVGRGTVAASWRE